jgi:hypothetical protein
MTPEQDATRDEADESQQQDKADGDARGERHDIAEHGQRDHREHEADYDPLARRQPGRPTGGQPQPEHHGARNQR